jgi:hypothetical protein
MIVNCCRHALQTGVRRRASAIGVAHAPAAPASHLASCTQARATEAATASLRCDSESSASHSVPVVCGFAPPRRRTQLATEAAECGRSATRLKILPKALGQVLAEGHISSLGFTWADVGHGATRPNRTLDPPTCTLVATREHRLSALDGLAWRRPHHTCVRALILCHPLRIRWLLKGRLRYKLGVDTKLLAKS